VLIFDETGRAWELGPKIAAGGEGVVHHLLNAPEYCAKIYHSTPLSLTKQAKLTALSRLPQELRQNVALPLSLIFPKKNASQALGVILPFIKGHDIFELYNPQGRREHFQKADFAFLVATACNLAIAFKVLHQAGMVMGDVNEKNIKIRTDATLCLIDCDSFQLHAQAKRFTCNVGTPLWTPPELQGVALNDLERTPNHDAFGLAQLIFLLLFAGRYPFAGKPVHNEPLAPEAAIAKYAFAFDPTPEVRLLEPPPAAPAFNSLPPSVRNLFLRAFRRGAERPGARPSPEEWIEQLKLLGSNLTRCPVSVGHVHWNGSPCPWCVVVKTSGIDLFPAPPGHSQAASSEATSNAEWVNRLLTLAFDPLPLGLPPEAVQLAATDALELEMNSWIPGIFRIIPFLQRNMNNSRLNNLKTQATQSAQALNSFSQQTSTLFLQHAAQAQPLLKEARQIAAALKTLGTPNSKAVADRLARQREVALRHYLEQHLIQRAQIASLGQSRRATLQSYHIITAWDITESALLALPGFGRGLTSKLLDWRNNLERGFQASYAAPKTTQNDPTLSAAIQKENHELSNSAKQVLSKFHAIQTRYARAFEPLQAAYHQAYAKWAALEKAVKHLNANP
jgi:DNA-binding helix-hairpin-helix protein with protein kinase domain